MTVRKECTYDDNIVDTLYSCPTLGYPLHPGIIDYYGTCNYRLPRITIELSFLPAFWRTRCQAWIDR